MLEVLANYAHQQPHHVALQGIRSEANLTYNYGEYAVAVFNTSKVLQRIGLCGGDRLLILSSNRPEWVIIDLAAQLIGVISCAVPAFTSDTILNEFVKIVEPKAAIVETEDLLNRAYSAGIKNTYQIGNEPFVTCFQPTLANLGEAIDQIYLSGKKTKDDKIAYLTPSSGTTGEVKACSIKFGNTRLYGPSVGKLMGLASTDTAFSFLPLSQTRMQDLFLPLSWGAKVLFTNLDEDIYAQVQQYKPTLIASPPFFFEEVKNRFTQAKNLGDIRTLKDFLGDAKHLYTGTTPVDPALLSFYQENCCPLLEVYGMTEGSSMATMNYLRCNRLGSQGVVFHNVQVRTAVDGEILISGSNVCAGYWNNPAKTSSTICDGWLYTGDIGTFDEEGFLHLLGRKKELIVLSNGNKVFPKPIEDTLLRHPAIKYAVLVGNGQRYLGVLANINENVELTEELITEIDLLIEQINSTLGREEKIIGWSSVPCFSIQGGELTTSFKLKRQEIEKKYSNTITDLFHSKSNIN